jgi:hypothetical protein
MKLQWRFVRPTGRSNNFIVAALKRAVNPQNDKKQGLKFKGIAAICYNFIKKNRTAALVANFRIGVRLDFRACKYLQDNLNKG